MAPQFTKKWSGGRSAPEPTDSLRSGQPPSKKKHVPIDNTTGHAGNAPNVPSAPVMLGVFADTSLSGDYYIDTPKSDMKTITYVLYGYDRKGNMSYPVILNASLADHDSAVKRLK